MSEVNVSVAVRVRPLLASERVHSHQVCVKKIPRSNNQLLLGKDRAFTFDNLFWWNSKQEDVFDATVSPLVETCFQGYNATVFAYGQTGSGKTHTIGGPDNEIEHGIIPRAVDDIFNRINSSKSNIHFMIKVSYVEIYMEEIRDLLEADVQKSKEVFIREDQNGNTVIVGAKEEHCASSADVLSLLSKGSALRHTGATQMNELSSRSHAIFSIHLIQSWPSTPRPNSNDNNNNTMLTSMDKFIEEEPIENMMSAKFHFVDLAGSERANRTGNTGERFKESIQINTGLLALGNVISALSDPKKKSGHVPYRDSKITRLLKDSLGGNARTLMIACISPSATNFDESLNTLKYATRAKSIKNKPVINRDPQQVLMEEMQVEIDALKQQLQSRSSTRSAAGENQFELERELSDLQDHCQSYQHHLKEAAKHLKTVCSSKQKISKGNLEEIRKWLENASKIGIEMTESITFNGSPAKSIIFDASMQIEEYKKALESDEKLFAKKDKQITELTRQLREIEWDRMQNEEAVNALENIRQQQAQKLIEQSVLIEQLQEDFQHAMSDSGCGAQSTNAMLFGRAQSVPHANRYNTELQNEIRAHSSPPLMSVEKVMAGFRARNHMITEQIEEEDEVEHLHFDDSGEAEEGITKINNIDVVSEDNQETPESDTGCDLQLKYLRESTILSVRNIKQSELRAQNANMKIKELSVNIKMKEQLIKELVKTGNDAEAVKRTYSARIQELEKKVQSAKRNLLDSHKLFQQKQSKADDKELDKLKSEYEHKLRDAKAKVQLLQKRQKEMEKMSSIPTQNQKKVKELEIGIGAMRQMQEDLQKKLKEGQDEKRKLETDLAKDKAKIKELEIINENQQKIVKRKTEEVAAMKKKLRSSTRNEPIVDEEQKKWLDDEVEKALEQQNLLQQLEAALRAREAAVKKREEALSRKSELEMKKIRSSQVISSEVMQVASKLASVDQELSARSQQLKDSMHDASDRGLTKQQQLKRAVERLQLEKGKLDERRTQLEYKLQNGEILEHEDERELIELDEAVEAYNAAIEWQDDEITSSSDLKNTSIATKRNRFNNMMAHFKSLPQREASMLLCKCFNRIIELRSEDQNMEKRIAELEDQCANRDRLIQESELALHHVTVEHDRKLVQIQQEHEHKTRQLLQQINDQESSVINDENNNSKQMDYQRKIENLEKDLFYYKSTSRELKKKLREMVSDAATYPDSARTDTDSTSDVRASDRRKKSAHRSRDVPMRKSLSLDRGDSEIPLSPSSSAHFRQGLKLSRQTVDENMNSELGHFSLPATSKSSSHMPSPLRRTQMQFQPSIPSNSVEYMQFQELSLQPRNSPTKKGSPLQDRSGSHISHSHPATQLSNHFITVENSNTVASSGNENIEPNDSIHSSTQVRIPKKELKRLPKSEVNQRRKQPINNTPTLQDSLDAGKNPWCN